MGLLFHVLRCMTHLPLCSTIAKFQAGDDSDWSLIAEEWPTFLYDERAGWNGSDIRNGLFQGHVLAQASLIYPSLPIAYSQLTDW
jgi:hypothetical protein